jgi:hypothetical protein
MKKIALSAIVALLWLGRGFAQQSLDNATAQELLKKTATT